MHVTVLLATRGYKDESSKQEARVPCYIFVVRGSYIERASCIIWMFIAKTKLHTFCYLIKQKMWVAWALVNLVHFDDDNDIECDIILWSSWLKMQWESGALYSNCKILWYKVENSGHCINWPWMLETNINTQKILLSMITVTD